MSMIHALVLAAALATAAPQPGPAVTSIRELGTGKYDAVVARLTPKLAGRLNTADLRMAWGDGMKGAGSFEDVTVERVEPLGEERLVTLRVKGTEGTMGVSLVLDAADRISGLWFARVRPLESAYKVPAYVDRTRFTEREVTLGKGEWALPGTLTTPRGTGPWPAVVLVHGSGPNDRDESIGPNRPFRDWAWGLASQGVAVLRYDKLTYAHGFKLGRLKQDVAPEREVVNGVVDAVAFLRRTPGIASSRIVVLGHSQGGHMLPRIATRIPGLGGLVSLAGPLAERTEDGIVRQVTYLRDLRGHAPGELERREMDGLLQSAARVKAGKFTATTPADQLPLGLSASFWLFEQGYRPPDEIKAFRRPMLVLQGGRDYQVLPAELDAWRAALKQHPDVSLKLYPSLNHEFRAGEGVPTSEEYFTPGSVDAGPIHDVANWVRGVP